MNTQERIQIHEAIVGTLEDIRLIEKQIEWRKESIDKAGKNPLFPNLIDRFKREVKTRETLIRVKNITIEQLKQLDK